MKRKKSLTKYVKYLVIAVCILLFACCFAANREFSAETILELTPKSPWRAAAVLLLLYAVKSVTIVFPLILLQIAAGHLFSKWMALGINFAGILIILTIPYWIGRAAGSNTIEKLVQKYPKAGELIDRQQNNSFFLCFFLRVISCLPGDIITMYLGSTKTPFWQNLLGGALGILPGMILATMMGSTIQDPKSPAFWISAILMAALSATSFLLYYLYRRKSKKKAMEQQAQNEEG